MNNQLLLNVYKTISAKNISVFSFKIPNHKAVTIEESGEYGIFIDKRKIEDTNEEFIILTHEYGHCISGSTHKLQSPLDLITKHEYLANKTAVLKFLPFESLQKAIDNGCKTLWEISDFLDLPEDFVSKAIDVYKRKNLLPA